MKAVVTEYKKPKFLTNRNAKFKNKTISNKRSSKVLPNFEKEARSLNMKNCCSEIKKDKDYRNFYKFYFSHSVL